MFLAEKYLHDFITTIHTTVKCNLVALQLTTNIWELDINTFAVDDVLVIDSVTTDIIHLSQFESNPTTRYSFGFIANRIFSTNLL